MDQPQTAYPKQRTIDRTTLLHSQDNNQLYKAFIYFLHNVYQVQDYHLLQAYKWAFNSRSKVHAHLWKGSDYEGNSVSGEQLERRTGLDKGIIILGVLEECVNEMEAEGVQVRASWQLHTQHTIFSREKTILQRMLYSQQQKNRSSYKNILSI